LEALFRSAVADRLKVDVPTYNRFRAGLLRHIGLEEEILLPTLHRLQGNAFPLAAAVMKTVCSALERAGYRLSDYEAAGGTS
jgi:hypothetical protein